LRSTENLTRAISNIEKQTIMHTLARAGAVSGIVLLCGFQAFAATVTGIKRPNAGETVEVLVQYATQPTEEQHRRPHTSHIQ
jgi:HrpA-like RNA helicase